MSKVPSCLFDSISTDMFLNCLLSDRLCCDLGEMHCVNVVIALYNDRRRYLPQDRLHFFFQLSAINLIARDLPANYRLVVKEHLLAIGRRPKNFYQQIADLKNVLIADCIEPGVEYIKNAKATACLAGTAGWEASINGKPVISFSKNNIYNFLDHVYEVKNYSNLSNIIFSIFNSYN